jgi:hypothetical protein
MGDPVVAIGGVVWHAVGPSGNPDNSHRWDRVTIPLD